MLLSLGNKWGASLASYGTRTFCFLPFPTLFKINPMRLFSFSYLMTTSEFEIMFILPYFCFSLFYLGIGGGRSRASFLYYLLPTKYFHYNQGLAIVPKGPSIYPTTGPTARCQKGNSHELNAQCEPCFIYSGLCSLVRGTWMTTP